MVYRNDMTSTIDSQPLTVNNLTKTVDHRILTISILKSLNRLSVNLKIYFLKNRFQGQIQSSSDKFQIISFLFLVKKNPLKVELWLKPSLKISINGSELCKAYDSLMAIRFDILLTVRVQICTHSIRQFLKTSKLHKHVDMHLIFSFWFSKDVLFFLWL